MSNKKFEQIRDTMAFAYSKEGIMMSCGSKTCSDGFMFLTK